MKEEIEIIKRKVSIEDIASKAGFQINRSGFMFSIFKKEKTPSLKVYPNNSFYCFATGQGGSVIDFYSGLYGVDKVAAINDLKRIASLSYDPNVSWPTLQRAKSIEEKSKDFIGSLSEDERYSFEERFGMAYENSKSKETAEAIAKKDTLNLRLTKNVLIFEDFYRYAMIYSRNEKAIKYLTDQRKISINAINRFAVFTFESYNQVSNHLKNKFPLDELQRSGLFNENGNLIFFKHRILIPYLHNSRIAYLRGRFFDENRSPETDSAKYLGIKNDGLNLNSPKRLFNSDILKTLDPDSPLYICEGEFDSIILNDFGFPSVAVAGSGNLPADEKLKGLLNFSIKIAVDEDEAGEKLRNKLVDYFKKNKKKIKSVSIPKKDINAFIIKEYAE